MPEVNQIALKHEELVELIIKNSDVHEGVWSLNIEFGIGTGNYGPAPDKQSPGLAIAITSIGIQRVAPGTPTGPGSIVVDAAKVNPK